MSFEKKRSEDCLEQFLSSSANTVNNSHFQKWFGRECQSVHEVVRSFRLKIITKARDKSVLVEMQFSSQNFITWSFFTVIEGIEENVIIAESYFLG